jgi:hypothetical protein
MGSFLRHRRLHRAGTQDRDDILPEEDAAVAALTSAAGSIIARGQKIGKSYVYRRRAISTPGTVEQ